MLLKEFLENKENRSVDILKNFLFKNDGALYFLASVGKSKDKVRYALISPESMNRWDEPILADPFKPLSYKQVEGLFGDLTEDNSALWEVLRGRWEYYPLDETSPETNGRDLE